MPLWLIHFPCDIRLDLYCCKKESPAFALKVCPWQSAPPLSGLANPFQFNFSVPQLVHCDFFTLCVCADIYDSKKITDPSYHFEPA